MNERDSYLVDGPVDRSPAEKPVFTSNDDAIEQWKRWARERFSPYSITAYGTYIRRLRDCFPDTPLQDLTPHDLRTAFAALRRTCRFRRRQSGRPANNRSRIVCGKGFPLSGCGEACPGFQPPGASTLHLTVASATNLYKFFRTAGLREDNPVRALRDDDAIIDRGAPSLPERPRLTLTDVRSLVLHAEGPMSRAALVVAAKHGLRSSELAALRVDPDYFNIEERWMRIPEPPYKRKGDRTLYMDEEEHDQVVAWLMVRRRLVNRLAVGPSIHAYRLFLRPDGRPLVAHRGRSYANQRIIGPAAMRAGLQPPRAPRNRRVTMHALRHFYSTHLVQAGIDTTYWWSRLRGDRVGELKERYVHMGTAEAREMQLRYAPQFDLPRIGSPHRTPGPLHESSGAPLEADGEPA